VISNGLRCVLKMDKTAIFCIGSPLLQISPCHVDLPLVENRSKAVFEQERIEDVSEKVARIRRELSGLDGISAGIIELRFYADLTLKAIGERLGLSTGAVHTRLHRSMKALRRRMKEIDDG